MLVNPTPQLSELLATYRFARDKAAEATAYADQAKDALKTAMLAQAQHENPADPLTDTELIVGETKATLRQQVSWRLDSTRLKSEYPEVYAAFAKQTSTLVLNLKLA